MFRIMLDPLVQKRALEPFLGGGDIIDCAKSYLGVEMLRQIGMEATLENSVALRERLVLIFERALTQDDRDAVRVCDYD